MNIPNQLTLLRMILAVPFIFFLEAAAAGGTTYRVIALVIFAVAAITDFLDGYIARKHNLITDFGKLMDPLADKILVISALVIFVDLEYIPAWMSIVVIAREFLISGIRTIAATKGEVIPAGKLGKYKTTAQMIAIIIIIIIGKSQWNVWLMAIPVILTIWSGWEYTSKASHYFTDMK